jgi:predicted porin
MTITGYTHIIPHPKLGVFGYNLSIINVKVKTETKYSYTFSSATTAFWTKPFQVTKKFSLSPGVFLMGSPYGWNNNSGSTWNYNLSALVGTGFSYKLSKRFNLALDYKLNTSTVKGAPMLNFLQFGTKVQL